MTEQRLQVGDGVVQRHAAALDVGNGIGQSRLTPLAKG